MEGRRKPPREGGRVGGWVGRGVNLGGWSAWLCVCVCVCSVRSHAGPGSGNMTRSHFFYRDSGLVEQMWIYQASAYSQNSNLCLQLEATLDSAMLSIRLPGRPAGDRYGHAATDSRGRAPELHPSRSRSWSGAAVRGLTGLGVTVTVARAGASRGGPP